LPELQLVLWDEERDGVAGWGAPMPARVGEGLPGGVDDMVEAWFGGGARPAPDVLSALVAVVDHRRRGEGLSGLLIEGMRDLAGRNGFTSLIAPVRPTWKEPYPWWAMRSAGRARWAGVRPLDPAAPVSVPSSSRCARPRCRSGLQEWEAWGQDAVPRGWQLRVFGALVPWSS
jgi:hypothetical protein